MAPPTSTRQFLAPHLRTLRILHAALVASLAIYVVVGKLSFGAPDPAAPPPPTFESMQLIFMVLAFIGASMFVGIPLIRRRLMPPLARLRPNADPILELGRGDGPAIRRYFNASIMTWAMCESIAVYGLVLMFMMRDVWPYPIFAVPAAALMFYYRPSATEFEAVIRGAR
jgi:F0F1-type ATP synthase membrane subunit c/vacuolar-type H+-ATPase subunit K